MEYVTLQIYCAYSKRLRTLIGTPNEQGCKDFMASYDTLVVKPMQTSVGTLNFTNNMERICPHTHVH